MIVELKELIRNENINFLTSGSRDDIIDSLVSSAKNLNFIEDDTEFKEAIFERESMISTGIGLGVAIPHAKLDNVKDFFIIVGINKKNVDWNSLDGDPVKLVFLIGGPSDQQKKYLQIIAKLTLLIKKSERRKKLLKAKKAEDVVEIFQKF